MTGRVDQMLQPWIPIVGGLVGGLLTYGLVVLLSIANQDQTIPRYMDVSVHELSSLVEHVTTIERHNIVENHKGRRISVSGEIHDIVIEKTRTVLPPYTYYLVTLYVFHPTKSERLVYMSFDRRSSERILSKMRKGELLSVEGRIETFDAESVSLIQCTVKDRSYPI